MHCHALTLCFPLLRTMNKPNANQSAIILRAMQRGTKVSSMWGMKRGIIRLTNRIGDLIKSGYAIESHFIKRNGKRYKIYQLS